ncbi:uncharacterized protein AB675_2503 [Cyphellophora attinorum]|uniref:Uncharacterized protein n=1 Tax=Cyphellophora attinorum TaxID=1664694 RepID=A0A0N0NRM0_9EURO|nr:uncharacterized protein AB675_2503 [Phialophora attinorum]KPI44999.1 hypothetical protein AB675_2503 [Phialophora attinorum]
MPARANKVKFAADTKPASSLDPPSPVIVAGPLFHELRRRRELLEQGPIALTQHVLPQPPPRLPRSAKAKHKARLTDKEIDVYLGAHLQGATLKRTKTVRSKLQRLGLADSTYEAQRESYKTTLIKTIAVIEGKLLKSVKLDLARSGIHDDQQRLKVARSMTCCAEFAATADAEADSTSASRARRKAKETASSNIITCSDPLCEISTYHASCLWAVEIGNYKEFANLCARNPLKGKWLCTRCVASRRNSGFPELPAILRELKRAEDAMKWPPIESVDARRGWAPVVVPGVQKARTEAGSGGLEV